MKSVTALAGVILTCMFALYTLTSLVDGPGFRFNPLLFVILSPGLLAGVVFLASKKFRIALSVLAWLYYVLWILVMWGAFTDDYLPQLDYGWVFFVVPWFLLNIPVAIFLFLAVVIMWVRNSKKTSPL